MLSRTKHGADVYSMFAEHIGYDPECGRFFWKRDRLAGRGAVRRRAGDDAGFLCKRWQYIYLSLGGKNPVFVRASRLAWFIVHGEIPDGALIDHINGVRTDNRICNLRLATVSDNLANSKVRSNNLTGIKGVKRCRGKYQSRITRAGVTTHLGTFDTPEEAHLAYVAAAAEVHGDFANSG